MVILFKSVGEDLTIAQSSKSGRTESSIAMAFRPNIGDRNYFASACSA